MLKGINEELQCNRNLSKPKWFFPPKDKQNDIAVSTDMTLLLLLDTLKSITSGTVTRRTKRWFENSWLIVVTEKRGYFAEQTWPIHRARAWHNI